MKIIMIQKRVRGFLARIDAAYKKKKNFMNSSKKKI